ncbi:MAG TPA: type IV pilus assembly protein PilM [Candidatus Nanoarchaeia archaeon]|nr:cell division protein FtsA [uncultured archaeon]
MPAINHFGLDIGTQNIKVVQLSGSQDAPSFVTAGMFPTPKQAFVSEAPEDIEALSTTIRNLHREAKITTNRVSAALPESQIFTRVVELPELTKQEIKSAINYEAEQYVPLPLTEVRLTWEVLKTRVGADKKKMMEILLVAAPNSLIDKYLKVLKGAGLNPVSLETETTAAVRSLVQRVEGAPTTLVVSIGASTTDLTIVDDTQISFTRSIATGGLALARAIANDLGFEMDQAVEYMKTYGLDSTQLEGKVMQALKPVFDVIVNEIRRALAYYTSKHTDNPVKRVIATGGTAKLPGLVVYLAEALGLEVQIGNPWDGIALPSNISKKLIEEGTSYSVAVGLALKQV